MAEPQGGVEGLGDEEDRQQPLEAIHDLCQVGPSPRPLNTAAGTDLMGARGRGRCPPRSSTLTLQELSRCALWLSAQDHQGSRGPEEKSQHNRQTKTDRQTDTKQKTNKKTGTECILIWENGSWLTTVNVNALSSLPTQGSHHF